MRAVKLYPADEVAHLVEVPSLGYDPDTDRHYGIIDGPIDFRLIQPGWGMFFDDEFRAKRLPLNLLATALYRVRYHPEGVIAGPAIVVGMDQEVTVDLPQQALDFMAAVMGFTIVQEV